MPDSFEREHLRGSSETALSTGPSASLCGISMSPAEQKIVNLISQRYITPSKQPDHPRRSYAYIKGQLHIYESRPELVITSEEQICDGPPK